jgi:putative acetyltransferase
VRPVFRGAGLGGLLVGQGIERARVAGYHEMVIETLPRMRRARSLCAAMGFEPCAQYLVEPTPGADCHLLAL